MTKALELLETMVLRQPCTCVEKTGRLRQFMFEDGDATLNLECPWRLLLNGAIAFGGDDDGQQFGLPAPLDGVKATEKLLSGSLVSLVEIREGCSDLSLTFQNGVRLEAFNSSAGYEGWTCSGKGGVTVVAQGSGIYRYGSQATDLKLVQEPIADFTAKFLGNGIPGNFPDRGPLGELTYSATFQELRLDQRCHTKKRRVAEVAAHIYGEEEQAGENEASEEFPERSLSSHHRSLSSEDRVELLQNGLGVTSGLDRQQVEGIAGSDQRNLLGSEGFFRFYRGRMPSRSQRRKQSRHGECQSEQCEQTGFVRELNRRDRKSAPSPQT